MCSCVRKRGNIYADQCLRSCSREEKEELNKCQILDYGKHGYGLYSQDLGLNRNPFTGRINVEREIDFTPVGHSHFRPYGSFPASVYQHYIN